MGSITHAGHLIAFLHFVTLWLWANINWWVKHRDGLSLGNFCFSHFSFIMWNVDTDTDIITESQTQTIAILMWLSLLWLKPRFHYQSWRPVWIWVVETGLNKHSQHTWQHLLPTIHTSAAEAHVPASRCVLRYRHRHRCTAESKTTSHDWFKHKQWRSSLTSFIHRYFIIENHYSFCLVSIQSF